jgi:hypothetical protein
VTHLSQDSSILAYGSSSNSLFFYVSSDYTSVQDILADNEEEKKNDQNPNALRGEDNRGSVKKSSHRAGKSIL